MKRITQLERLLSAELDARAEKIVDKTLARLARLYPKRKFGITEGHGSHSFMVWDEKSGHWQTLKYVGFCDRLNRAQRIAENAEDDLELLEITVKGYAKDRLP